MWFKRILDLCRSNQEQYQSTGKHCPWRCMTTALLRRIVRNAQSRSITCTSVLSVSGKKVKCALVQALRLCTGSTNHRGSRVIALLFLDHGTRRGWGASVTPGRSLIPGKTRYPLYRRLGGPQGRTGQVRKISPPPGYDPRTVQPIASRYTDYVTRPACVSGNLSKKN